MLGGPDHVDHLENQMSTQQREANATFYHDPTNPLNNTQISLPQRWRWMYPYILETVASGVGAFQAHQGEPLYNRVVDSLADMFQHHVQASTQTSARHGFTDMIDVSPGVNTSAVNSLGGGRVNPPISTIIENAMYGRPLFENIIQSGDAQSKVPGQNGGNTNLSHNDSRWLQNFLSSFGSGLGTAYQTYWQHPSERYEQGASAGEIWDGLKGDVVQNFKDNTPMGNIIWGNTARLSKYNPLDESVSHSLQAIRDVGTRNNMTSIGYAGAGPTGAVLVHDTDKLPDDPVMKDMWLRVANFAPTLAPIESQRNIISTQMQKVDSSSYSAQDKRDVMNGLTGKYNDLTATLDGKIKLLNAQLSQMAGGRVVNVSSINWHGTPDQFHR
jgi:hypothetical protein